MDPDLRAAALAATGFMPPDEGDALYEAALTAAAAVPGAPFLEVGSYCGRSARIKRNTTTSGEVWLNNFVRFAPCGIGFHQIPTWRSNGRQMHPDWYLGTNFTRSHGCIRLSRAMSLRVWNFTVRRTPVRVV